MTSGLVCIKCIDYTHTFTITITGNDVFDKWLRVFFMLYFIDYGSFKYDWTRLRVITHGSKEYILSRRRFTI